MSATVSNAEFSQLSVTFGLAHSQAHESQCPPDIQEDKLKEGCNVSTLNRHHKDGKLKNTMLLHKAKSISNNYRVNLPEMTAMLGYGFRDIKINMDKKAFDKNKTSCGYQGGNCYNLDYVFDLNWKVYEYNGLIVDRLEKMSVRVGVHLNGTFNRKSLSPEAADNLYKTYYNQLVLKYFKVYEFTKIDRLLFNGGQIEKLYIIFENGQVALVLVYESHDAFVEIEFRTESGGLALLREMERK